MKGLKLDTAKLLGNTAGNAIALVGHTGLNRIPFVKKQKPVLKGAITVLVARLALPWVMSATGMNKGKNSGVGVGAEEGLATLGLAQVGNNFAPNLFPAVSGVDGYEDSPYLRGLGIATKEDGNEDNGMNGADEENVNGNEDDNVYM